MITVLRMIIVLRMTALRMNTSLRAMCVISLGRLEICLWNGDLPISTTFLPDFSPFLPHFDHPSGDPPTPRLGCGVARRPPAARWSRPFASAARPRPVPPAARCSPWSRRRSRRPGGDRGRGASRRASGVVPKADVRWSRLEVDSARDVPEMFGKTWKNAELARSI